MGDPYPYVCVDADGNARELHESEQRYLETPFEIGDGARPSIKRSYSQRNGWGDLAGYLKRSDLPPGALVHPAPTGSPFVPNTRENQIAFLRRGAHGDREQ